MNLSEAGVLSGLREPVIRLDSDSLHLDGRDIALSEKKLKDLEGVFADENTRRQLDPEATVYKVQSFMPVADGTPGGLFFGNTTVYAGKVRDEYFMTRGHFHSREEASEYYWCVKGEGALLLMDASRTTWAERVFPGSIHYISGSVAHRLANTGRVPLVVWACWHSDAGHDYESIERDGFSARLLEVRGAPGLVESR